MNPGGVWSMGIRSNLDLGVLGINLGAEHNPHERVSNENVMFSSMLLKQPQQLFSVRSILSVILFTTSGRDDNMQSSFWPVLWLLSNLSTSYVVLIACTWALLPLPRTTTTYQHQCCSLVRASLGLTGSPPLCVWATNHSFFHFFFGCATQHPGT